MKCSECGTVYNDSYAECPKCKTQPQEDLKKCPFCAELIKAEAVKCKHCKSDLPGFEPKLAPTVPVPEKNNTDKQAVVENESPSPKKKIEPESGKLAEPKSDEWWHNPKTRKKMYAVAGTAAVLILLLIVIPVSYTHLRAHETRHDLV